MSSLPDWVRIVLLVLSVASFIPQLRQFWLKKNSSGISLIYVLFNLICVTELFTISFFATINVNRDDPGTIVTYPVTAGDCINVVQVATVWALWLVVFGVCIYLPSENKPLSQKVTVCVIYFLVLLITLVPSFIYAATIPTRDGERAWSMALFYAPHIFLINPFITMLEIGSFFAQGHEIWSGPAQPVGLSVLGLGVQAAVFALVGVAWLGRLEYDWDPYTSNPPTLGALGMWFLLAGSFAVDNLIFAVGQGVLFWLARRRYRTYERVDVPSDEEGETEPLLGTGEDRSGDGGV